MLGAFRDQCGWSRVSRRGGTEYEVRSDGSRSCRADGRKVGHVTGHELTSSFSASAGRFLLTLRHRRHLSSLPEILGRKRVGRERETGREMDAG